MGVRLYIWRSLDIFPLKWTLSGGCKSLRTKDLWPPSGYATLSLRSAYPVDSTPDSNPDKLPPDTERTVHMKRFYCTVCQKVKRVRKMPANVSQVSSEMPALRHGACRWHSLGRNSIRNSSDRKVGAR